MSRTGPEYIGTFSLIALGAVLGPSALGVLTPQLLTLIDPAVPAGLAALGVLAGLELRAPVLPRLDGATVGIALGHVVAGMVVAVCVAALAYALGTDSSVTRTAAAVAAICTVATRTLHPLWPILLGGLTLAWLRGGFATAAWTVGNAMLLASGCAVAGWLMLRRRSSSESEHRALAVALLLLIGGSADYLAVSALLGGLSAGVCWRRLEGPVRESMRGAVTYLRHPMLAIVLLTAGASTDFTVVSVCLGLAYALAGVAVSRFGERLAQPAAAGSNLFAIALALSAFRAAGVAMAVPLAGVVVGTMLLQLVAMSRGQPETLE